MILSRVSSTSLIAVLAITLTNLQAGSTKKLDIPNLKESAKKTKADENATNSKAKDNMQAVAQPVVEIPQEKMKEAIELYNKGKFMQAYKLFQDLFNIKSDDAKVNFYLGRCATELKLYDEALEAFERVLLLDPAHVRSHMEIGRIYFEEKSFDNSEAEFKKALEYPMPDEVKAQINQFLAVIADSRKKNFISGAFIVGAGYDTNVKNDVGSNSFTIPTTLTQAGNKPVYDYSLSETLAVNHKYKIDKSNWNWTNSLVLYNQDYRQAVDSNVLFSQIGTGAEYNSKEFTFSIGPTIENLKYGLTHTPTDYSGLDRITGALSKLVMIDRLTDTMDAVGIGQKFSMPIIDTKTALDESLSIKKQYFKTTAGMDAVAIECSVGIKRALDGGKSIGASVVEAKNLKVTDGRTDVAYEAKTLKVDYSMPVQKYFDLAISASIKRTGYQDEDQTFFEKEEDLYKSIGLTATKIINPTTILTASWNRIWNDSTLPNKVYQKNTLGFSLIKAF
jgi:tetratricopeptide (TPR) repeat protein